MGIELSIEELETVIDGIIEDGIDCSFDESSIETLIHEDCSEEQFIVEFDSRCLDILEEKVFQKLASTVESSK